MEAASLQFLLEGDDDGSRGAASWLNAHRSVAYKAAP